MLSVLSYKVINAAFSGVSGPAIIILFVAMLISTSNIYLSFSASHYRSLLSLITLSSSLIGYMISSRSIKLLYIFIP